MGILDRLNNDVNMAILDSPYYVNQDRKINKLRDPNNTSERPPRDKRFAKRYLNGGVIVDNNKNYNGYFNLELDIKGLNNTLVFKSFEETSSNNFEEFINNIYTSQNLIIDHYDLSKELNNITELKINNSNIDYKFTNLIKKYFHKLKRIEFNNCRVTSDSDFSKIDTEIKFYYSNIDNIRVFNNTYANFEFWRTNINNISPCTINSNEIRLPNIGGKYKLDLKELFLKVNFPELKSLDIRPDTLDVYSFEDSLMFLPYSAPFLENLYVGGKVRSLDFLERLPYLLKCSIESMHDDSPFAFFYPYVTDKKEREKLSIRNKESIKYLSKLNQSIPEKFLMCEAEYRRIMDLKDTFYLIKEHYDGEYNDLINHRKHNFENTFRPDGYYSMMYYKLVYKKNNESVLFFSDEPEYKIENNIMYDDSKRYDKDSIMYATKFIYHPSGIPILFNDRRCKIKPPTYEELCKKPKQKEYTDDDLRYDSLMEVLEEVEINSFSEYLGSLSWRSVPGFSLNEYKKLCKKLYKYMSIYDRHKEAKNDIALKNDKVYSLLLNLIEEYFDKFTVEEEALILDRINDYVYRHNYYLAIDDFYYQLLNYDWALEESINEKTNGLYMKYKNLLKETKMQLNIRHNVEANKPLTQEDIKELKLNLKKLFKKEEK